MATEHRTLIERLFHNSLKLLCGWHKPARGKEADCEALTIDPVARLAYEPVEFPSLGWRIYLGWLPLVLIAAMLLKIGVIDRARDLSTVYIGWGAIVAGFLVYLIVPAFVMKRRIRLEPHGFEIIERTRRIFVPWKCLLPHRDWGENFFQLRIPVSISARDEITVFDDLATQSVSEGAKMVGLKFVGDAEIDVTWSYHLDPELFMDVAKQMALSTSSEHPSVQMSPLQSTPRSNWDSGQLPAGLQVLQNGILQVPLSAVTFPPVCCRCGTETDSTRSIDVIPRYYWWLPARMSASLEMPVCSPCWRNSWIKSIALFFFIELGWILAIYATILKDIRANARIMALIYLSILILFFFPTQWIMSLFNSFWRVATIVQNVSTGEFRFRFADPNYCERVIQSIRDRG